MMVCSKINPINSISSFQLEKATVFRTEAIAIEELRLLPQQALPLEPLLH